MSSYQEQIGAVVAAIRFRSAWSYSWFGISACPYTEGRLRKLPPHIARSYLLDSLRSHLYSCFYCPGRARPLEDRQAGSARETSGFVERLSAANCGRGCLDGGWHVIAESGDRLKVSKAGLAVWVTPDNFLLADDEGSGLFDRVAVRLPNEQRKLSPGFYMALGDKPLPGLDNVGEAGAGVLRVYWNVGAKGAVRLVELLTGLLNSQGYPFRLKVLTEPERPNRCDRAVLYMRCADWPSLRAAFAQVHAECAPYMGESVPALSKAVGRGLAVAEDPGGGDSFGQHRCRLIAEGLLSSYERGVRGADERLRAIAGVFAEHGLDVERPYLSPGSEDVYDPLPKRQALRPPVGVREGREGARDRSNGGCAAHTGYDAADFLRVATQIGNRLAGGAMWSGELCNWLAADKRQIVATASTRQRGIGNSISTLGPDLYRGTAGVALFLGELWAITGDEEMRRTAYGGIKQALLRADLIPQADRAGLYTGWFGIVHAARRLAVLLGDGNLEKCALDLVDHIIQAANPSGYELLSGSAGALLALVRASQTQRDGRGLEAAVEWGDRLVAAGTRNGRGLSWSDPAARRRHNLCGFSHGAAGIAYALLELYAATEKAQFRRAAEQALEYESSWLDARLENWPDLRSRIDPVSYPGERAFATYWCHGAPGIAISRLRAFELLGTKDYLAEARMALRTTRSFSQGTRWALENNFCLCHGLAGNAEVLRYGVVVLRNAGGPGAPADAQLCEEAAQRVARLGTELYAGGEHPWPCGDSDSASTAFEQYDNQNGAGSSGAHPGLMTGLAGVGLFYLRMYNNQVPTVIVP